METNEEKDQLSKDQIEQCISILESLNNDTDQIFDIPKEKRTELIKQAGLFARPDREELKRRKKKRKEKGQKGCSSG